MLIGTWANSERSLPTGCSCTRDGGSSGQHSWRLARRTAGAGEPLRFPGLGAPLLRHQTDQRSVPIRAPSCHTCACSPAACQAACQAAWHQDHWQSASWQAAGRGGANVSGDDRQCVEEVGVDAPQLGSCQRSLPASGELPNVKPPSNFWQASECQ